MHQTSPHNGTLITWGKGFTCPGAVGKDPAVLLEEALTRQGMQVEWIVHCELAIIRTAPRPEICVNIDLQGATQNWAMIRLRMSLLAFCS